MEDELNLLKEAVAEISSLRRQNELMNARLEMFDNMIAVLHTQYAHRSQGMSPDLVWKIQKFIDSKTPARG